MLAHSRLSFDMGVANVAAVPVALLVGWLISASGFGRLLGSLMGMPFHELGHASVAWLSSRFAIPLPFFTIRYDEQSLFVGLVVAAFLGWSAYQAAREGSRFAAAVPLVLLCVLLILSLAVSARRTLMWEILSGALGELSFSGFLLIAFFFPMTDRSRWDFWRWVILLPAAIVFTQALRLWRTASLDVTQMPWGSAIGSESDGDMNRLVAQFDWQASELAGFYLRAGYLWLFVIGLACVYAAWRHYRAVNR